MSHRPLQIIAVSLGLSAACAAAPATLTLQDAVVISLRQDPALRVQAEAIEQQSGLLGQASGAFDWIGNGGASVSRERTPVIGPAGTSPVDATTQEQYSIGVDKLFRNGISISPTATVAVNGTQSPYAPTYGASQVSFAINVPLLRGLGNDDTGAAEAAQRGDVKVARLLYESALASQALTVASNYWASKAADETLDIQLDVEKGAERLVESTKVLVDGKVFAPAYLLQAEANLRDKRSTRIAAELAAKTARYALGLSMGLRAEQIGSTPGPSDDFPALVPTMEPASGATQNQLINSAIETRPDMLAQRESVVPLNILARAAQLELKPLVNLSLSAGYAGLNSGSSLLLPLNQRITGANGQVGLTYSLPFENTYQLGLLRERRADARVAEAQADDYTRQVANSVLLALESVRLNADNVRSAKETVDLADRALSAQYESLKAGTSTIIDVITLENLSSEARVNYVSAYASYATALAQFRFALGVVFTQPNPTSESFSLSNLTALPPIQ